MDSASDDQAERFARAVESRTSDPEFDAELAIVAALRDIDVKPDDLARARMRKRVLNAARPAVSSRRGRFAVALAAALALVFALAGMSFLLSKDALPGDALYGVKKTAEAASMGLTFGDQPKALKRLEFAAARVDEMTKLAELHPDLGNAPVGGYLTALTDFDNDTSQASRQLIALSTRGDLQQLNTLKVWSGQQDGRLAALDPRLPIQARDKERESRQLLVRIADRVTALLGRVECYQITTGASDDIGLLPASDACQRPAANTLPPGVPSPPGNPPKVKTSAPQTPPPAAPSEAAPTPLTTSAPPVPLVPVPVPTPPTRPADPDMPSLPIPILQIPALLPGLPAIRIG
ncbi:DUF5667 domain-containing protein [Actinocrispum wychmicini]|uniref:DUF5667 domain-containing protein n=1 Tax=Actinocrispum wychmicini TaxID=1213861 RepID=UPI001044F3D7|nr:DUF5667 domain-containing protein [Actinocrispum wychmicini]